MSALLLAPHAYACFTRGHAVLLDLRKDKYFALSEEHSRLLAVIAPELSSASLNELDGHRQATDDCEKLAVSLIESGLATRDAQRGKRFERVATETAARALEDGYLQNEISIRPAHVLRFLRAYVIARVSLRWRRIESVVSSIQRRKSRSSCTREPPDDSVRQLYTVFERLRPWLYTARDACLFDSLTLMEFLAEHGVAVNWVFGVKAAPFAAHCWIQQGNLVLNDVPETVRRYTPIMSV